MKHLLLHFLQGGRSLSPVVCLNYNEISKSRKHLLFLRFKILTHEQLKNNRKNKHFNIYELESLFFE